MAKTASKKPQPKPTPKRPLVAKTTSKLVGKSTSTKKPLTTVPTISTSKLSAAKSPVIKAKATTKSLAGKSTTKSKGPNGSAQPKVAPQPVAAATGQGKAMKNQAGLKTKELEFFRDLLLAKRRELLGDVHSMEEEALRGMSGSNLSNLPIHMADMGTDNYEQEFTLGLVEKDRQLLREINVALAKIRDGTYGICEGTGKPITKARLEAKPWARHSIEWTRQMESNMMIRR